MSVKDQSMCNQFPVTDPRNYIGKIMRGVAEVVKSWDAANKHLLDEYVIEEFNINGGVGPLRDLLVLYGNGSDAPKGVMRVKAKR